MENNQRQIEYPQSDLIFKSVTESEEHVHELAMVHSRFHGGRRRRTPAFPKAKDSIRCQ